MFLVYYFLDKDFAQQEKTDKETLWETCSVVQLLHGLGRLFLVVLSVFLGEVLKSASIISFSN